MKLRYLIFTLLCSPCFAQQWSTLSVDTLVSMNTSTPGTTLTTTIGNAGNYPGGGCTIADGDALAAVTGSGTGATIDVTALTANGDGTVVVRIPYTTVTAQ